MSRRSTITPCTFTKFLRARRRLEGPQGDFARDWTSDVGMGRPRGAYKWPAVARYLEDRNAIPACMEAAEIAWKEWQTTRENVTTEAIKHQSSLVQSVQRGLGGQGKNDALSSGQGGQG